MTISAHNKTLHLTGPIRDLKVYKGTGLWFGAREEFDRAFVELYDSYMSYDGGGHGGLFICEKTTVKICRAK